MSRFEFKLPDLGEGTVDAEIVEWKVKVGDHVDEDQTIVDVMTDKANIEVPSPVTGTVLETTGEPGDLVPVGATLIVFETQAKSAGGAGAAPQTSNTSRSTASAGAIASAGKRSPASAKASRPASSAPAASTAVTAKQSVRGASVPAARPTSGRASVPSEPAALNSDSADVLTSPSIRRRAREAGIELATIRGSGADGRITQADFDAHLNAPASARTKSAPEATRQRDDVEEIKVIGVRRVIAQRLSEAARTIPHFAYVEEIDVTELERLRAHLNAKHATNLTYLPFLALALIRALPEYPQCNAHFDAERNVLLRHRRVHLGVATQTPDGLKVPVVHDAQTLSLWELADEIRRVSEAARDRTATKDELTGSTITVTSLGRLGGIASTPIINAPEVAIIGVNKAVQRPMIVDGAVAARLMMNLSSSFDHRFVDGYDAAALIQAVKGYLEQPAAIFV